VIGGVAISFGIATCAVRRCADLRRETAALALAARAAGPLRQAGLRLPDSVLGGELLAMMSVQLRDRLRESSQHHAPEFGRDLKQEFAAPGAVEKMPSSALNVVPVDRHRASFELVKGKSTEEPVMAGKSPVRSIEGIALAPVDDSAHNPSSRPGAETDAARSAAQELPWARPSPADRESTMSRKLREYWDLERRSLTARPAPDLLLAAHRARETQILPTERETGGVPRFGAEATFAQRLQAFVSGQGLQHDEPRSFPTVARVGQARMFSENSGISPAVSAVDDFSERLVGTLREQAIQHSIDLS
jgi:hypothetical protein